MAYTAVITADSVIGERYHPADSDTYLDTDAGRQALERAVQFLASLEGSHAR